MSARAKSQRNNQPRDDDEPVAAAAAATTLADELIVKEGRSKKPDAKGSDARSRSRTPVPAVSRSRSSSSSSRQSLSSAAGASPSSALSSSSSSSSSSSLFSPPSLSRASPDDADDPARSGWGYTRGTGGLSDKRCNNQRNRIDSDSPAPVGTWSRRIWCAGGRGSLSWFGMAVVCFCLALSSFVIHILLEILGEKLEGWSDVLHLQSEEEQSISIVRALAALATLLVLLAVPLTHGIVGVRRHHMLQYTFWQPFVGGMRFVLLQVLAWTIWTITVLAGMYAAWVGTKKLAFGWLSAVGLGGVVSQLLVLVSLHFFVSGVSKRSQDHDDASAALEVAVAQHASLMRTKSEGATPRGQWVPPTPHSQSSSRSQSRAVSPHAPHLHSPSSAPTPLPSSPHAHVAPKPSPWSSSSMVMKLTFLVAAVLSLLLALFMESSGNHPSASRSVSALSLLTSAILLAVPITHMLARRSLTHAGYLLFQPFQGGERFVALQAVAWTLWTLAFVSAGSSFFYVARQGGVQQVLLEHTPDGIASVLSPPPETHWISSLITSAGVGGVLSQALVLLSLKYFDKKISNKIKHHTRVIDLVRRVSLGKTNAAAMMKDAANAITGADAGKELEESLPGTPARVHSPALSESATVALLDSDVYKRAAQVLRGPMEMHAQFLKSPAALLTELERGGDASSLSIPSPLSSRRGTPRAASKQVLSPSAAAASTAILPPPSTPRSARERETVEDDDTEESSAVPSVRGTAVVSPAPWCAPATPAVLVTEATEVHSPSPVCEHDLIHPTPEAPSGVASLTLNEWRSSFHFYVHQARHFSLASALALWWEDTKSLMVVGLFFGIPILGALATFMPLVFMYSFHPLPWWGYTIYASCFMVYVSTYRNRPSITGTRSWEAVRHNQLLWGSIERYFHGRIVPQGSLSQAKGPYIFGFHPHGVYPMTCMWATRGPQFAAAYPELAVDVCGATIMFYAPLLRDICMCRLTLVTRHRGFIRMAIEHGTPLVPVLSLGETMLLENVHAPRIQAYTLRTMGVGFPIWPYGRWFSPLPNPHPVTVVFGHPIEVPYNPSPSAELIESVHAIYYAQLQNMFLEHRHMVPGMDQCKLVFTEE